MKLSNMKFKPTLNVSVIAIACGVMMSGTPDLAYAAAEGAQSGNERINFSGKLRMLSQRTAAAGCNLNAGVDPAGNAKILTASQTEFNKILGGLRAGNGDLKIEGAETDSGILADLDGVATSWAPINAAIVELTKNPGSEPSIEVINGQNLALLGSAKSLVSTIVGVYADNSDDDGLGATIDVAGRQRMLTQKMSKDCLLYTSPSPRDS